MAKKAALIAITTNLHIWMSNHPNMLSQHSEASFMLPKRPIWMKNLQTIISKAKIGLEDQKTRETVVIAINAAFLAFSAL